MSRMILKGQECSPGIAIGPLCLLPPPRPVAHYRLAQKEIPVERKRLHRAMAQTGQQWERLLEGHPRLQTQSPYQILQAHRMLLNDPIFKESCEFFIRREKINAEWAVERTGQQLGVVLGTTDETTTFKRQEDIQAVVHTLLQNLSRLEPFYWIRQARVKNRILVTDYLSPQAVVFLKQLNVTGLVTQSGGRNAHSMILARSLCLPAVSGIADVKNILSGRPKAILNGFEGTLIVEPTREEERFHRELLSKHQVLEGLLLREANQAARTRDKKRIWFEANVELPEEVPALVKYGAEGIGLFRTESLFWNRAQPPSEKKQLQIYARVLTQMPNTPVTFRTLDLSGEEWMGHTPVNPALGLRGIRFSLKETRLLETQLRALLKAGANRLLLPMVTSLEEIEQFKKLARQIQKDLKQKRKILVGIMVEVPAAGLLIDQFARAVDFFAIGSNDLIQYTLAMDRTNEQLAENYSFHHPAIIRMLFQIVQNALKAKRPVYLCGELGADPLFLPVLLGMGLNRFSMNPLSIPRAKKMVRLLSAKECRRRSRQLLQVSRAGAIEKILKSFAFKLDTPWRAG
ncbi:MAG: phosphoenolpyruvate--protein phosphotransferase [Deltaproteobacteria bacterium]|nr:phosphoenolpyruvate--protein phosphotransferase [Deltaproteobacteria bacterium]